MILRKPYALFIKYFKLLHVILSGFIMLLLYRSFTIYSFFRTYSDDYRIAINSASSNGIVGFYSFIILMIVIIVSIILLSVMVYKSKPKKLYIYNIILYIAVAILYGFCYSNTLNIRGDILDIRVSKALGDFTLIAMVLQAVSLILVLVRATGFDIKRFDFVTDLQQLDIDEKDSEEIEVALEFDKNIATRDFRKRIRHFRYVYAENKFIINTVLASLIVIISFLVYFNRGIYNVSYNENTSFSASGLTMNVRSSYIVQKSSSGKDLVSSDDVIAVVKLDVKSNGIGTQFNTGLVNLRVGGGSYSQDPSLAKELLDLGTGYDGQELTDEYQNYILAFNIPSGLAKEKMVLKINDNVSYVKGEMGAQNIMVDLKPVDLREQKGSVNSKLGETISFEDSILGGSTLQINKFELGDKFKSSYNFCYGKGKCYESYEYITPTATGAYNKTLLKLEGLLKMDLNYNVKGVDDFNSFMNMFGTINYKINDKWYSTKISSQIIKPKMSKEIGVNYIEVIRNVKDASEINLTFDVRNMTYKYVLK